MSAPLRKGQLDRDPVLTPARDDTSLSTASKASRSSALSAMSAVEAAAKADEPVETSWAIGNFLDELAEVLRHRLTTHQREVLHAALITAIESAIDSKLRAHNV